MKTKFKCSLFIILILLSIFSVMPICAISATIKLSGVALISPRQELIINVDFSNLSVTAPEGLGGIGQLKISYNPKLFDLFRLDKSDSITENFDFTAITSDIKVNNIDLKVITLSIISNTPNSVLSANTNSIAYLSFKAKDIAQEQTAEFAILNDSSGFIHPTNPEIIYDDKIGIEAPLKVYIGKILSDNAKLSSLSIENMSLSPEFSSENKLYSAKLVGDISDININYLTQETDATVSIIGDKELKEGKNRVSIQVTAPDKFTVMEYVVNVNKVTDDTISNIVDIDELNRQLTKEVESLKTRLNNVNERFIYFLIIFIVIIILLLIYIISNALKKKAEKQRIEFIENLENEQYDDDDNNKQFY